MKNLKIDFKIKSATKKSTIGTSRIGTVHASFKELKEKFGEPHDCTKEGEWESRDSKVRVEWAFIMKNDKRLVFTIYDYKNNQPLEIIKSWNLGSRGKDKRIIEYFKNKQFEIEFC
ncbi:MAG: hypothetical protein PF572_02265 [Patescibacteria group bacterium]|jgi:hypothetical protein|nr:hypothetical protein [Patescibacteria group bacterium]